MKLLDQMNNGLIMKNQIYNKIALITKSFLERFGAEDCLKLKEVADHFVDGGWSGTSEAIFNIAGWKLIIASSGWHTLQLKECNFLVKRDLKMEGHIPPYNIVECTYTLQNLMAIEFALNNFLFTAYERIPKIQNWINDLRLSNEYQPIVR